jgi:hypothetical protein
MSLPSQVTILTEDAKRIAPRADPIVPTMIREDGKEEDSSQSSAQNKLTTKICEGS